MLIAERLVWDTLELDRDDTSWLLTYWLKGTTVRLRIRHDEWADFDCADHIAFEAKLPEAETFVRLGTAVLVPYLFTSEGQEASGLPCVCRIPSAFQGVFVQLVSRWGELRCLCPFAATLAGTPIMDMKQSVRTCPRCRHQDLSIGRPDDIEPSDL